jgi:branched-chain amino acid transport system substrate-binding protein
MYKRFFWLIALLVALALVATACGGGAEEPAAEEPAAEAPAAEEPAAEEPAAEEPAAEEPAAEEPTAEEPAAEEPAAEEPAAEEPAAEEPAAEEPAAEEGAAAEPETVEGCTDAIGCVTVAPGEPIRLAGAFVLSGPNESLGLDERYGAEVALAERGEIFGHPLELQPEDEGCSAEGGQTAATKISSDESIVAILGHTCSSSCTPAASIYNDAGYTMVSSSCTAPALTDPDSHLPSFLRTATNDQIQGSILAEYAYNELGARTAATIHDGSPYAEQLQQVFADRFTELGGEVVAQEAVNVGDTDMRPVLTSIATGSPDILYYPIFIAEGGFITTQAKEISGLEETMLSGSDGLISPDFIDVAGEAAEGMYVSGPNLTFTGEMYDNFKAAYTEIAGQEPFSAYHAHTYDAASIVLDAIEQVAQQDAEGNLLIGRQALRDALYATQGHEGITGTLACDANGDCADPQIAINQVQNGEYVAITGPGAE